MQNLIEVTAPLDATVVVDANRQAWERPALKRLETDRAENTATPKTDSFTLTS